MNNEDWEAVAADQALTVALLRGEINHIKACGVIHQVIAYEFAEMSNPENQWVDFSWNRWIERMVRKTPDFLFLYGLKLTEEEGKKIVREFATQLVYRADFKG